jgi:methylenetetrahydrofolate dehydrogenase (NAD+)
MATAKDVPGTCKVVTAETNAKELLGEVRDSLQCIGSVPSGPLWLTAFLANDDPAAIKYAQWSKKTCEEKCAHGVVALLSERTHLPRTN